MRFMAVTLTFAIGLAAFTLWNDFQQQLLTPCGPAVNSINPRRLVRVRGILYGSPDGRLTLNESECGGDWAAIEFHQSFQASGENLEFIERLNNLAGGDRMARAEVIVTGTFNTQHPQDNSPSFVMSVTGIEQAGPISLISLISN